MCVIGWFSAIACIHPGIVSIGTYALDTKVSGKTMRARPCAACADPANMPSAMKSHSNANPNTMHNPNAASASESDPWIRKPTAKPIAVVMVRLQVSVAVDAVLLCGILTFLTLTSEEPDASDI